MSNDSVYDRVPKRTGQYVKWTTPGQVVAGDLVNVGIGTDFKDEAVPEWTVLQASGEEVRVTCGQANLHTQAMNLRPVAGDYISITYSHDEKVPKGSVKVFVIDVISGGAKGVGQAAATARSDEFS